MARRGGPREPSPGIQPDPAFRPVRRAVVITVLEEERDAIGACLIDLHEKPSQRGLVYQSGLYESERISWDIGLVEIGKAGNVPAAVETDRAIDYFKADVVFFVGVAGGLKDVAIGDVVVATKIVRYEAGADRNSSFEPRPETFPGDYRLLAAAQAANRKATRPSEFGKVFFGPIAAGEKVVKGRKSGTGRLLKASYGDALAVEMEGAGFALAAHSNASIQALVIRGVSDLLDKKAAADASGSQKHAAQNAAHFLFSLLDHLGNDYKLEKIPTYSFAADESNFSFDILSQKTRLILDETGATVRLQKKTVLKVIGPQATTYVEDMFSDGRIEMLACSPALFSCLIRSEERYLLLQRFDRAYTAGEELVRKTECCFADSFLSQDEYWTMDGAFPVNGIDFGVVFPASRPPRAHQLICRYKKGRPKKGSSGEVQELSDGRVHLLWHISQPSKGWSYRFEWRW